MDKLKERTGIYHEHQQGALCAQHALNNLLQAQMFLADALADIARELDADEKSVLTQTSFESENMDDTGFFSIQVLQRALKIFEIELVPRGSQELIATQARNSPESIQAYICNLGLHWFTIRRFGKQYFDLNSLYYVPELISNMALLHYLKIIEDNGYSVFIVHGSLPVCVADQQLAINPISMSEYRSLTKDLPKYIMDDKIIENMKGLPRRKNGEIVVQLPRHLMEELKKNPDNPEIRELIYSQLPKGFLDKEMSGHAGCSDPNHHHPRPRLVITDIQDDLYDEQLMGVCDCPFHRQLSQGLSPHSKEQVINSPVTDKPNEHHDESQMITPYFTEKMTDDPNIFNLKERQHEPQMITERVTQLIVTQSNPNNPNEPPQQKVITKREVIVTSGSLQKNATLIDSQDVRQMTKPSIGAESDDDYLLQHVMAQSLLDTSEPNENINKFFFEEQSEQLYQQSLDKAIAASLATNNSTIEQAKETPELIPITNMNSSPTSTMDSQPVIIKMPSASTTPPSSNANSPSLTNTHSLPSIDTSSLPPTNTYSLSPTNTTSPPPTNMYSTPPTDKSSPPTMTITKNSPPPIVTDVDDVESPSVEELRQRRLQFYGNRDRSIISQQSDLND